MTRRVPGVGPVPCDVAFIGEFPGKDEVRIGQPMVGRSGREFMRYLNGYIIPRTRPLVYLTNLSKQFAPDTKSFQFDAEDERQIWDELAMVQPKLIVTLGAHATRYFLGDLSLEMCGGIPHPPAERWRERLPGVTLIAANNPAAALYSPSLQSVFAYQMRQVGRFLRGTLETPPRDRLGDEAYWLDDTPEMPTLGPLVALDTEGIAGRAWGGSYCTEAYTAVVRKAAAFLPFGAALAVESPTVVLHNSLHDLAILRELGVDLETLDCPVDDTMVMAYLIGLEPQGLKALAYRHAGMTHQDYMDLVAEADERLAVQWLLDLHDRLPADPRPEVPKPTAKMLERFATLEPQKAEYVDRVKQWQEYAATPADTITRARARALIAKTLEKDPTDAARTLRQRWSDGRARELLTDELGDLGLFDADPPEPTLDDVPEADAVRYAARDADATFRIYRPLRQQITDLKLDDVYRVDMAIIPMIDRMQAVGLGVDLPWFRDLSLVFQEELLQNARDIELCVGQSVNPSSGDQVAALLYDRLGLQKKAPNVRIKPTKSGDRLSTNDKILDALSGLHPVVGLIQEGRELRKLLGAYTDPIPKLVGRDGRLHPRYRITRTDTGRLAAGDPNVLAFPKHSARGKLVTSGFVAGPGRELASFDYKQIEMVVFACDSEDQTMIAEILSGVDKHTATAARIYRRPPADIQAEHDAKQSPGTKQRFTAKAVNFGTLMGITEYGLTDQMHKNGATDWTIDQSADTLEQWRDVYTGGWAYIQAKHAEGRRYGFVRDMWGRIRWLEGIRSADDYIRAEAERMAQATPIQSGAQGIVKRGMRDLWPKLKEYRRRGVWVECLLQRHDELLFEWDQEYREELSAVVRETMEQAVSLQVPIQVSADYGQRLGEL